MNWFDYINEEIYKIAHHFDGSVFDGKTILITGATGLIGSSTVRFFSFIKEHGVNVEIIAVARNREKVKSLCFSDNVTWIYDLPNHNLKVDYVIHSAGPTDSSFFVEKPSETIIESINLYEELIKSVGKTMKSFVYLSSMEVYGNCIEDRLICEDEFFPFSPTLTRSSYPEVKRLLECLSVSLSREYHMPIKIARLCQTFGPGVSATDNRVFAQFARCVAGNSNIVLTSKGDTKRSYCSISDSILGILFVLLNGKNGEAYNISSNDSYCSILELAKMFAADKNLEVMVHEEENPRYLRTIKYGLDISKAKAIGFSPITTLKENISLFIDYYRALLDEEKKRG